MAQESPLTLAQLAALLEGKCIQDVRAIPYAAEKPHDLVLLSLYLTIVENAHAIGTLIKAQKGRQGYPLLRSMWEASLDVELLIKDEDHLNNLKHVHASFWLKQLRAGRDGNPFVQRLGSLPDADTHISRYEDELQQIRAAGGRKTTIAQKCERLGRSAEYDTVYAMMSNYGHNSLQALISNHFEKDENNAIHLAIFAETPEDDVQLLLDGAINIVKNSSRLVHLHFNTGRHTSYE